MREILKVDSMTYDGKECLKERQRVEQPKKNVQSPYRLRSLCKKDL